MAEPRPAFGSDVLDLFEREEEIDIETTRADGSIRSTVIWIVVEGGEPYVRSVRGPQGRWYRDVVARPRAAVAVAGRRVPVMAVPAADPAGVAACSAALRRKYGRDPSLRAMLVAGVLPTTLRLEPR